MSKNLLSGEFVFVSSQKAKSLSANLARSHDLVFTQRGTLGQVSLVPEGKCKQYLISQSQMKVSLDRSRHDPQFVRQYFASRAGQRQILTSAIQTGVPHTNLAILRAYRFPAPPLAEQQAIGKTLGDVDALLGALDRLIAKKRDLKQAAMQKLLTGQTRLPGFTGKWQVQAFGQVLVRINAKYNQIQTTDYQATGAFPVVDQGKSAVVGFSDKVGKLFQCPEGGVIVFGDHTCIVKFIDFDFLVGADGTQIIRAMPEQNTRFHAFHLQYKGIEATGYNRHFKFLKERHFVVPPVDEQAAIATVLSDMDAELEALEQRRAKTAAIKQGMMQELLTGRTRLA